MLKTRVVTYTIEEPCYSVSLLYFRWTMLVQTLSLKSNLLKVIILTLSLENIPRFFHMNMKGLCLLHDSNSLCLFD